MGRTSRRAVLLVAMAAIPGTVMAQESCVSLRGSTQCSAFSSASFSTDSFMVGLFPFLSGVTSAAEFDSALSSYIPGSYASIKYGALLGCSDVSRESNPSSLYARFTTSVICNAVIQNSVNLCGLSAANSRPLCAESCASYAESEANIVSDSSICKNPIFTESQQATQIRADFTTCALPANSLDGSCVPASDNEPDQDNCGFSRNLVGLCQYCASGSVNSTDTCCYNSQTESRCENIVLPTISASIALNTPTATATSVTLVTETAGADVPAQHRRHGLSGGAIAGIVIGSIVGLVLILALIFFLVLCCSRRRSRDVDNDLNHPTPARQDAYLEKNANKMTVAPEGYEVLPGGRIARMSALEGHSHSGDSPPREGALAAGAALGAVAGNAGGRHRNHDASSSDEYVQGFNSAAVHGTLGPPPVAARRGGSLSSGSALAVVDRNHTRPSIAELSHESPPSGSGQLSEQLASFRDYYSNDDINVGDRVATLWDYQKRANDEFSLSRGDMLQVVGIWDDGWATGIMCDQRADEWDAIYQRAQRDSGISQPSMRPPVSAPISGEIKAFPLVCVSLPQHWRKAAEGDTSTETGSSNMGMHRVI